MVEKDIAVGSVGSLDLSFAAGKALVSFKATLPGGLVADLELSEDASVLVDLIFGAIEKASPAGAVPIEASVQAIVKAAVKAIG